MHLIGDLHMILNGWEIVFIVLIVAVLVALGRAAGLHRVVVRTRILLLILAGLGAGVFLMRTFLR